VPVARAGSGVAHAELRIAVVAVAGLVVILALGLPSFVPAPFVVVAGLYGAQLTVDDVPLDVAAPAFADIARSSLVELEIAPDAPQTP